MTFPHKCLQSRRQSTWVFPSSETPDPIIKKLIGSRPIPDGFVLADEVVRRIRSSELALAPRAESGWYDYQTWALKALVLPERMPEGERLRLDAGYTTLLDDLFKGLLTLTRETHVKQLEMPIAGAAGPGREVFIDIPLCCRPSQCQSALQRSSPGWKPCFSAPT